MHYIRTSLLVALLLALGSLSSPVFAQGEPDGSIRIADVSVHDSRFAQVGNEVEISFTIKNGVGTQSGVKVAVELRENAEAGGQTIDRRVYDE